MEDEEEKLMADSEDVDDDEGENENNRGLKSGKSKENAPSKGSIWSLLFSNSSFKEIVLMGLGSCAAFIQGTAFPSLSVIFGSMSDSLMNATIQDSMNFSTLPEIENKTIGDVHFKRVVVEEFFATPDLEDVDVKTSYFESLLLPLTIGEEYSSGLSASISSFSIYSILIGVVALGSSAVQKVSFGVTSSGQHERRKTDYYQNVLYQDQTWFDKHRKTDVVKEFHHHLADIEHGTGEQLSGVIQKLTGFISGLAVAITKSWPLALVLAAIIPILTLKSAFNAKFGNQSNRKRVHYRNAGKHALQVFSAIRTVAAFGAEPKEIERYKEKLKEDLDEELCHHYKIGFGYALANFCNYAAYALAFWAAAGILVATMISAGTIYAILLSVMLGASDLAKAFHNMYSVAKAKTAAALVDEVVQGGEEALKEAKEGLVLEKIEGSIQFKNVHFKYPVQKNGQNSFALKNINIEIEPQTITALVGTRSSGKSSIIKLLQRFYEPNEGLISIDGHPAQTLNIAALRRRIGVVPQVPFLFNGTVKENIGCGKVDASDEEIIEAAQKAFADEFISSLPQGYDTIIEDIEGDDDTIQLTREQKQLISIARVILFNPDVIILDCPLLNEQIYPNATQAMGNACEGRTVLIISDRVSDVQFVTQIYVFDNGDIVESGTADELMESDGLYKSLFAEEQLMDNLEQMSSEDDLVAKEAENETQIHAKHAKDAEKDKIEHAEKSELEEEVEKLGLDVPSPLDILKLNMPEKFSVYVAMIAAIVSGAILPFYAIMYSEFFNTFMKSGDELWEAANFNTIMFLVLACGSGLATGLQVAFAARAGEKLVMRIKLNAFSGIIRQSISWFEEPEHTPEKLAKRLAIDAELVRTAGIDLVCNALTAFTTVVFSCIVILYSAWKVGLIILLLAYPFMLINSFRHTSNIHAGSAPKTGKISAEKIMQDCVSNILIVQELGLEEYFYIKYKKAKEQEEARLALYKQIFKAARAAFNQASVFFAYSGIFGGGGFVMSLGLIDAPSLFRIFFSVIFCAGGIGSLIASIVDYRKGQLATALLLHMAEMESTIDPFRTYGKTPRFSGELVASDAHFSYPDAPPVIDGLSFKAEKRRILALAGPPSSGKSNVFALYERFYDVSRGRMLVDGYDVRDLKLKHLRGNIGLVPQSPFFFDATIHENLTYGIGEPGEIIPDEKIFSAAKLALVHDFILSLPQRYDTMIGPKGLKLSERQMQRLAFARALIRDPCILLVDEPKIYNEPEEDRRLAEEVLDRACEGRTCIVIARSNHILQHSDSVAFMGNGKIVEMGTPKDILAAKGIEYELKGE